MPLSLFVAGLLTSFAAHDARFCYPVWHRAGGDMAAEAPAPEQIVAESRAILVAEAVDTSRVVVRPRAESFLPNAYLTFKVLEVLKGSLKDSVVELPGKLVEHDEYNSRPVPYRWARTSALQGSCVTSEYRRGARYLLMLSEFGDGELMPWSPLMPVNEQLTGSSDPWLAWVRREIARVSPRLTPHN